MLSKLTPYMWGFALIWLQNKHLFIHYPQMSNVSSIHIFFFQMTSYLTKELMSMHVYRLWTTYMHYCITMNWFDNRYVCIYSNIQRIIHLCLPLCVLVNIVPCGKRSVAQNLQWFLIPKHHFSWPPVTPPTENIFCIS
jgi:hypothetical protein